jgi:drug/metabolite transporter (DMT)-like permease
MYLFLILFGAFLWGIAPITHKFLLVRLNQYTIMVLTSIVYLFCLFLTIPFFYKDIKHDLEIINSNDILLILFESVVLVFIGNFIYYYVLKHVDANIVSALYASTPFFTLILAYAFLHEKINLYGVLGILFIVFGVVLITLNDGDHVVYHYLTERH